MFAEKGMRVVNDIYFIMRVNLCWFLFVIEGGVILGLIPATITLFSCIRNRMKNDFQGGIYREFKAAYWENFKTSIPITVGFAAVIALFVFDTAVLNGVGRASLLLQIVLRATRLLIVLTGILFFPVYVHFDLHGSKVWLQPFLFLFICPFQVVLILLMLVATAMLYMFNPLLVAFLGVGFPAYFVMGVMLKKFNKLAARIPSMEGA